ncbi:type II CAAX prenyl endopeptidase Rce1 family protein [Microbacterium sp. NPDC058345]|uniref:CPBP family glutamic-type intramembrane protease n=1 Tax=Microbacterium sp. NPDC058345 TaxID=3346455 RepID=UPI003648B5F2
MTAGTVPTDQPPRRARQRHDWRDGGRTVKAWDESVLAIALVSLGISLLVAAAIRASDSALISALVADGVVLIGMLTAVVIAFLRARPKPLLRIRGVDVVYGLGFGLILRMVQGWLEVAAGASGALPAAPYEGAWAFAGLGALSLAGPLIEEVFLRGVLLVTAYSVVRRMTSAAPAMITALLLSATASAVVHAWTGGTAWEAWLTPLIVALSCGALVMMTGRIWGAVFVHLVFSATHAVLAFAGAQWG